jgi:hypothetical protein
MVGSCFHPAKHLLVNNPDWLHFLFHAEESWRQCLKLNCMALKSPLLNPQHLRHLITTQTHD